MIINRSGVIIRMAVANLRVMGRATQGVRLIKIDDGDSIAAVAKVDVEVAAVNEDDLTIDSIENTNDSINDISEDSVVNNKTDDPETEN
jgi:DNA gyrase subunit A